MRNKNLLNSAGLALSAALFGGAHSALADAGDLLDMSIEQLADLQITSVSRAEERLADAPAAVFVITGDEIRRSGVRSIAEALRLAPGVEVARRNAAAWSITIRGFNSDLANKLLVLIDGRSVYSPLYAGVFWDVQDTLLEDIDRIEVIAGPGGTLWGANAVNGVINIITRPAASTSGAFLEAGGGNEERGFAGFRYGGTLGRDIAARAYVKYFDRGPTTQLTGAEGTDAAHMAQAGFRLDWGSADADRFTVQGDVYGGEEGGTFQDSFTLGTLPAGSTTSDAELRGANALARWERTLGNHASFALQAYYDHTNRDIPNTYHEKRDTLDVDFQHHLRQRERHDVLWGMGFRSSADEIGNSALVSFDPDHRDDHTFSAFLQDKIALKSDKWYLTLGSKFEHNDYTGSETQPNVRLSWLMSDRQSFWTAASRAVRIPARLDVDLQLTVPIAAPTIPIPVYVTAEGNHDLLSETLLAYEAGYRIRVTGRLSFDLSVFQNSYDHLQTVEPGAVTLVLMSPLPYAILHQSLESLMEGHSSGGTFVANWQPVDGWRLRFQYTGFDLDLKTKAGSTDALRPLLGGNSPGSQVSVHSFLDLPHALRLYVAARRIAALPNQGVPSYVAVDTSLLWRPRERLDASFSVQNLNDDRHVEFSSGGGNQIERSAFLRVLWSF
ncbi:MAG: TonB-dependent receptor [Gammaproteobacteria bacterium]